MVCPGRIPISVPSKYMITGQAIALVHHPLRITVHSVQDGREEHSPPLIGEISESTRLTGVWWFKDERQAEADPIPDIFKRGTDIVWTPL
jgi:anaphase-promoting complex subunit 4